MSNLAKRYELDPELAALYGPEGEAEKVHEPTVEAKPRSQSPADAIGEEDPLMVLKRMAEENQRNSRDRRQLSGLDQVEHDVSNVLKVGWDYLTRPLDK